MWFGEPHPFSGKRIAYRTERVGATKLTKGDRVDLDIYNTISHWILLHVSVRKGSS